MQKAVKVRDGDTPETLQKKSHAARRMEDSPGGSRKYRDEIVRKKAEEK